MVRAVIYCRVSTNEEVQINALSSQIEEAKLAVSNNKWLLVDKYIDEGKTGTSVKKRNEYTRLFNDMETDKFDIIVIKSQDRLMRSTKDWYLFVDKLVKNDKKLFFYIENKFYTPDDALITGIRAILAEDYSRELSKKINNAHSHRQKSKGTVLLTSNTWGYDKVGKNVVINENEAEVVRLMYDLCIQGYGTRSIAKILTNMGKFSRTGKPFSEGTIRKIIRNPLFKGVAVMNKTHYDFNRKKNIHNDTSEWIFKENGVPPIVSSDIWQAANSIMNERTKTNHSDKHGNAMRGLKKGSSPLSSKIICGYCNSVYWRRRYRHADGEMVIVWSCSEYVRNGRKNNTYPISKNKVVPSSGGCDNIHIKEEELNEILLEISSKFYSGKDIIFKQAVKIIGDVISDEGDNKILEMRKLLDDIMKKRDTLLDMLLNNTIDKKMYKIKDKSLTEQINEIESYIAKETLNLSKMTSKEERISAIKKEIENIVNIDLAINFIQKHIKNIIVYSDYILINYDIFPQSNIKIEQINYRKRKFILAT